MSGGIIIQRRAALLGAAKDPSLYDSLPQRWREKIDAIDARGPAQCTDSDLRTLAHCLLVAIDC